MSQNGQQTIRKSGVEILRIIGIIMVVSIHAAGLIQGIVLNGVGSAAIRIINVFGNLGVTSFILISGYFGVKRDWKKMLRLEMKVIIYSVCTSVLIRLVWPMDYPRSEILPLLQKSVMPVVTRKHWYYSCYMCMLIFSPYLNLIIEKIHKMELRLLIGAGLIIFSLAPTFLRYDIMQDGGKGLVNMVLLYFVGRYIRLYENWKVKKVHGIGLLAGLTAMLYGLTFVPVRTNLFALDVLEDNSITIILICIAALYLVKDLKFSSQTVNRAASHVFGIYILNMPVMQILDHFIFKLDDSKISGNWMPVWVLILVAATVFVCFCLDLVHDMLFSKLEADACDWIVDKGLTFKDWLYEKRKSYIFGWLKEE